MTLNTASILAESSRFSPDSVAVIVGDVRLTYSELWLQAKKYAAVLASHGIVPGDHVALMIPNIHEFPIAYYAVLALGAVVVPIHSLLKPEEIEYLLGHSKAACIITSPHHYEQVLPALSHRSTPLFTVASQIAPLPEGAIALDALSSSWIPLEHVSPTGELDPAVILYTSGTTGRPKGAVLWTTSSSTCVQNDCRIKLTCRRHVFQWYRRARQRIKGNCSLRKWCNL